MSRMSDSSRWRAKMIGRCPSCTNLRLVSAPMTPIPPVISTFMLLPLPHYRICLGIRAEPPYLPLHELGFTRVRHYNGPKSDRSDWGVEGRQHLLRFEANAVGWGSGPCRPRFVTIAAASGPPPGSPRSSRGSPISPCKGEVLRSLLHHGVQMR